MSAYSEEMVPNGNDSEIDDYFLVSSLPTNILNISELNLLPKGGNDSTTNDNYNIWAIYNLPSITFLTLNLIVGLFGNGVVIYTYGFCLKSTPMNCFVVSLAVLDIITCGVGMPLMILHDMLPYIFVSDVICKVLNFIYSSTIIASGLTLVTIALDRYRRICRPLSNHLNVTQVKIASVVVIAVAAVSCIPVIIMAGVKQHSCILNFERRYCYLKADYIDSVYSEIFYSYKAAVILLTIIVTVLCYFRIWFKSKAPSVSNDSEGRRMSIRTTSVRPKIRPNVKKMFMITLLFIFSFLPSICCILIMMSLHISDENLHPVAISFVNICRRTYLISCSLNPVICWYCNATFRLHVKYIISNWLTSDKSCTSISEETFSKQNDVL